MSWPMTTLDQSRLARPGNNNANPLPPPPPGIIPPWLQRSLEVGAVQEIASNWVVPSRLRPINQEEIHFLKNHTVQDLLKNPREATQGENNFWKQFVITILSGLAAAYVSKVVSDAFQDSQGAKPSEKLTEQAPKPSPQEKGQTPPQTVNTPRPGSQPPTQGTGASSNSVDLYPQKGGHSLPSEAAVVGKELKSRLIKIAFKEGAVEIENRISQAYLKEAQNLAPHLREAHIAEGKQVGLFVSGTLKKVVGIYEVSSAIVEDPTREGLLNLIFEKTRDAIVDKSKEVLVDQVAKIAPKVLGKALLTEMTGGLDTFFTSPELNPNEAAQLAAEEWKHLPPPWETKRPITDYLPYTTPSRDGYFIPK